MTDLLVIWEGRGGWGILRNWGRGHPSNEGDDFEMGEVDTPLQTM